MPGEIVCTFPKGMEKKNQFVDVGRSHPNAV